ncbi:ATP-grasp domain-containing protein [Halorubrum sp. HHNYT27]|uniref:ATP-grasp domain-containing protein n=1 Tax=Halorubrum sp. HHNYT27 TaxID=3402275 RepID=UPI003EBCA491
MTLPDTAPRSGRGRNVTVMVTGAGTPGAVGIIKAIRRTDAFDPHIIGVETIPDASGFPLVDTAETVSAGDDFIQDVIDVARREDVDVVFPLRPTDLQSLSEAKPRFESEGIEVMVSDPETLSIAMDTGRLYDHLVQHGHQIVPEFYRVSTCDEFVDAVRALGYPDRRVCFKRSDGNKVCFLDSEADGSNVLLDTQPNNTVSTLDGVLPIFEEIEPFPDLIVTEYLPGDEYSVDVIAREDDVPVTVSRSHDEISAGHSYMGTIEEAPELIESARQICALLGIEYNANFRFKYAADGTPKLVEVNPHLSESVTAYVGAGANIPSLSVQHALGWDLSEITVDWGTHVTHDWQEIVFRPGQKSATI